MYRRLCFLIGFLIYFVSTAAEEGSTTTSLITVENPKPNQVVAPSQLLLIQYTVHGTPTSNKLGLIPNYPSSMEVVLQWVQNNNTQQSLQLKATGGLDTDTIAGGRNKVYIHRWKLPNCRFFKRYVPSDWSFSLIFEPSYPPNNTTVPIQSLTLGPQQATLRIPLSISFNATATEDRRHRGC